MQVDQQGHQLSGATTEAVGHFDAAVRAFNIYRGDPVALADAAIACAPGFAMAHILKAYLFALATEPEATTEAIVIAGQVKQLAKNEREASLAAALDLLLANNWTAAAVALDHHNMQYPHDLVALQAGHLMDFYRANARNLRDRIARVLPRWSQAVPGYPVVLGMYAFGLEEMGDYSRAEAMGREAVQREPLDCWAHHAVAHVLEMQGRPQEGIDWMLARQSNWSGDDNFFKVHNWWHKALYHLELGQNDEVMSLYDGRIRDGESAVALDLVDASALLWRAHTVGIDVGGRWSEIARHWDSHADGKLYPFNDWHAAMAYLGAGQIEKVDQLVAQYCSADRGHGETAKWAQQFSLPLIGGFKAFWQGNYSDAVETLHGARYIANALGGSHAQRDVIDWTLAEAAIRSGRRDAAEAIANERLAVKPHSPINQSFLKRATGSEAPSSLVA